MDMVAKILIRIVGYPTILELLNNPDRTRIFN